MIQNRWETRNHLHFFCRQIYRKVAYRYLSSRNKWQRNLFLRHNLLQDLTVIMKKFIILFWDNTFLTCKQNHMCLYLWKTFWNWSKKVISFAYTFLNSIIPWLPRFFLFSPGDLIPNFPTKRKIYNFSLINMHEQTSNSQKNSKQC